MAEEAAPAEEFIQSKLPADNGYGQNGYRGASSDLPGENTSSNFLPKCSVDAGRKAGDFQTRSVDDKSLATTFGMKPAKSGESVPTTTAYCNEPVRASTKKVSK